MATIIKNAWVETTTEYRREFERVDESGEQTGSGASFPCDPVTGEPLFAELHPNAIENYYHYLKLVAEGKALDMGAVARKNSYQHPAVIECARCHSQVELDDAFLSTCGKCGADYNGSGQLLAPREQWGEETGESLADMLNGGLDD